MYKGQIEPAGTRDLDKIDNPDLARIKSVILGLARNPRPHGVNKLEGPLHRVRIGNWRVIYAIEDDKQTVTVLRVLRRSERTYKRLRLR